MALGRGMDEGSFFLAPINLCAERNCCGQQREYCFGIWKPRGVNAWHTDEGLRSWAGVSGLSWAYYETTNMFRACVKCRRFLRG